MANPFQDGWTIEDMEAAIQRNVPDELLYVPVWISMDPPDCAWAERICIKLSSHDDFNVRGNAILGFGHLAHTCGSLDLKVIRPIVLAALEDRHEYVRGHAEDVVEDIEHFMQCKV